MKGRDFLAFASKIAVVHHEEAARRSAISRAYYGGLHRALELFRSFGITVDTRHDNVANDLKSSLLAHGVVAGRALDRLRELRVKADYRLENDSVCSPDLVAACVESASELLILLDLLERQLTNEAALRDQFLSEIRAARAKTGRRS